MYTRYVQPTFLCTRYRYTTYLFIIFRPTRYSVYCISIPTYISIAILINDTHIFTSVNIYTYFLRIYNYITIPISQQDIWIDRYLRLWQFCMYAYKKYFCIIQYVNIDNFIRILLRIRYVYLYTIYIYIYGMACAFGCAGLPFWYVLIALRRNLWRLLRRRKCCPFFPVFFFSLRAGRRLWRVFSTNLADIGLTCVIFPAFGVFFFGRT